MSQFVEKPTEELRQIIREQFFNIGIVVRVQRKWLVQTGDPYSRADFGRENDVDIFLYADGDGRPWYAPMREEWRNLPTVIEEQGNFQ